ncbi:sperm surface protein Sp17-like [Athalia rosae]|uniref:sperm surface protein Sp17-like n=1 Tax=Athalia rosae TaxID=37344 RepID=UPI002033A780|nr:sperm surface protein Sp17-like [Athalia rosae]
MYAALQKHGARHVYRLPEGLRELCSDISREVLRAQPEEIYSFIADYIDALLITRENAKVAVRVVNNILIGSESIVGILYQSGLSLEQIAVAATRIQKVFRSYLDLVDVQQDGTSERKMVEENSRICIREILKTTGTSWEHAEIAASTIQATIHSNAKIIFSNIHKPFFCFPFFGSDLGSLS